MTPSNHSAEATPNWQQSWRDFQDPYLGPDTEKFPSPFESFVAGFDAGVADTKAQQYAATREALARALALHEFEDWAWEEMDAQIQSHFHAFADALLASTGPLLDVRGVQRNIAARVRTHCTPSVEAYRRGGDFLVEFVADWIENPPEWIGNITESRSSAHREAKP